MKVWVVTQGDYGDNGWSIIRICSTLDIAKQVKGDPGFGPVEIEEWIIDYPYMTGDRHETAD